MNKIKPKYTIKRLGILIKYYLRRKYPNYVFIFKWLIISFLISLLIGSASAGFLFTLDWATNFREQNKWIIFFLPLGGMVIGFLYYYFGKEVESGNNLIIDTIHNPQERIPFRMAPFIYLGTIVSHLFGGSAGREGTAVQMAGAITDQFSKVFQLTKYERKTLIIASVAGGFGSVFGTPLAGALFALEFFFIGQISYQAIFPAFITAIFSDFITHLWQIPHTHYCIKDIPEISFRNIVFSVLAGIIFGLCAYLFSKLMSIVKNLLKSKISYPPLRPFYGGILVVFGVWIMGGYKYIGLGIPTIVQAFEKNLLPYDFILKMFFTVLTISAGFKGGEVTPLFFIGATLGNTLSLIIPLPLDLIAGMGFVAVFAGATNTPIACTIMAIELFGSDCGVYMSIACVVSYLSSGHTGIYKKQIIGIAKHHYFQQYKGKKLIDL